MKKIIIMIGIVASAFALNAATVDWQITLTGAGAGRIYDKGGTTIWSQNTDATAYLLLASQTDAFTAALKSGSALTGLYLDSATSFKSASGVMNSVQTTPDNAKITLESQSFQTILVYKDADNKTMYMTSTAVESPARALATDPAQVTFGSNLTLVGQSQWTAAQAAPEPTSGLLLLLGMAGLALRRKQK